MNRKREKRGIRNVNGLIDFIMTKPPEHDKVTIDSKKWKIDIPVCEKDVMCMKVIRFMEQEYGTHNLRECVEMLVDTIWWLETIQVAFDDDEKQEEV